MSEPRLRQCCPNQSGGSYSLRAASRPTASHAIVVAILVPDVDAPKRLPQRRSHLESWIVVDHRARVVAELAVDLLNRPAEVAHQQLWGFAECREAVYSHEYLGMRQLAAARKSCDVMAHFEHVLDQADFDGRARKQRSIT